MKILFFVLFSSITYSQSFINELSQKTVGKFLYDKNIKIKNDTINVFIKVNKQGYCYATDFVSDEKINWILSLEATEKLIESNIEWIQNNTIIQESLKYDEFQSFDYLSHRGRNHRYDSYNSHVIIDKIRYVTLHSDSGYAILSETTDNGFLTIEDGSNEGNSSTNDWIEFNSIDEGLAFLNSAEVKNKGKDLSEIHITKKKQAEAILATPLNTIELPYKLFFDWREIDIDKHLQSLFGKFKKTLVDNLSFKEAKKARIYKEIDYSITDTNSTLNLSFIFYNGKVFSIGYSHWNNYYSRISDLDAKIIQKLELLQKTFDGLFELNISENQIEGNHLIWIAKEKEKFLQENELLLEKLYLEKKDKENNIGNKM